jgi:glycosyltransferase involved in cell wall biosynthesis
VARWFRAKGTSVVLCSDTAWRGDLKQWVNVCLSRLWLARTFSHAWVTGRAQAGYVRKLGLPQERIRTGFYAADAPRFLAIGERLLLARADAWPHRFLCVARYIPTKGQQLLCDAFASLCDAGDAGDWELWFVGAGEELEQVRNSPTGRHGRIRHLGFRQVSEMEEILAQCGVLVLPSTYEPWGVVVHEQACAGMPLVLSSAVGAAERFLVEGSNGHRFIAGDVTTLRTMLRMMVLSTDAELRAMGQRSHALGAAWTPGDWAKVAVELIQER